MFLGVQAMKMGDVKSISKCHLLKLQYNTQQAKHYIPNPFCYFSQKTELDISNLFSEEKKNRN